MIHTTTVSLSPADVLARAQQFFIAISAWEDKDKGVTRVRASTLFFDQALDRFFSTLPLASQVEVA